MTRAPRATLIGWALIGWALIAALAGAAGNASSNAAPSPTRAAAPSNASAPSLANTAARSNAAPSNAPTPVPIVVTTPVRISNGRPFYENPILTLLFGGAVAYAAATAQARQQRAHEAALRAEDRARQAAYAQADGLIRRFENQLGQARRNADDSAATARTLRVLAALLSVAGRPHSQIADLPLIPASLKDAGVRAQVHGVAELLAEYRTGQPAVTEQVLSSLRSRVAALADDVADEARAAEADVATLSTTGQAKVFDQADTLRKTLIEPPG